MKATHVLMLIAVLAADGAQGTCRSDMRESSPMSRFTPRNGGASLVDTETGLEWKRCPEGFVLSDNGTPSNIEDDQCTPGGALTTVTWRQALQNAEALNTPLGQTSPNGLPGEGGYAGASDWRVPNLKELTSIVEDACVIPAVNLSLFPLSGNYSGSWLFWTSSSFAGDLSFPAGSGAWVVNFGDGAAYPFLKPDVNRVRLVRGGS